ncbi:hypothetical protein HDU99_003114 [Rhizoclosmatium hyalinum]|nr:hypothetical protein HDU99_003114 [Rhizoclosmatium hyalinum]
MLVSLLTTPFKDLSDFLDHSIKQFSLPFMLIIGVTYFFQGFRSYAFGDGIIWFFSDVFELDPGPVQLYMSTIFITWNIKMCYGLLFDNFPLFGRKDIPYMVLSGAISFIGFMALGIPSLTPNPDATTFWFFLALMGLAMSDVIADSMVVVQARRAGENGGANLQAFCWVCSSIGGLIGRPIAGWINGKDGEGSRILLGIVYSISSLVGCIITLMHKEQKCENPNWSFERFRRQVVRLVIAVFGNRLVWLPMSWIILNQAIVPDVSAAMNFWKQTKIDIGADKKAYIDTVGDIFAISGLVLYTKYFKQSRFSLVFFWTQIAISLFALSDIVLVERWNVKAGISDEFFLIGSQTIINTLYNFQAMPFFVLAAQLCPTDIEATFYAAMMSIGNIGGNIGTLYGGYLLEWLHIVKTSNSIHASNTTLPDGTIVTTSAEPEQYDFTNLTLFLWIRVASMAASALFVFVMVPNKPEPEKRDEEGGALADLDGEETKLVQNDTETARSSFSSSHSRSPSKRTRLGSRDIE